MTRKQKIARARELREQGWSYQRIADELSIGVGTAFRYVNPEAHEHDKAYQREHMEQRRANDRAYSRRHRGVCKSCGGQMGIGHKSDGVCRQCVLAESDHKLRELERLWNEGKTYPEMAAELGWSLGMVQVYTDRARGKGYSLPYRYTTGKRAGRKFPEQVAA